MESGLHIALERHQNSGLVQLLLSHGGADIEALNRHKETPLFSAARGGHLPSLEILLVKKLQIDAQNVFGQTPLHLAIAAENQAIVELLITRGASLDVPDEDGVMARDLAAHLLPHVKLPEAIDSQSWDKFEVQSLRTFIRNEVNTVVKIQLALLKKAP